MAEILKEILEKRMEDGYLRLLLNAFEADQTPAYLTAISQNEGHGGTGGPAVPVPATSGGLSDREIDVLLLIAERLSNKEIAERLFVAPETVKKHTANLYRKLNAHSRREAVTGAMKLGLIPRK
jgi:LuxR family maltose regulon positive regulatory protein